MSDKKEDGTTTEHQGHSSSVPVTIVQNGCIKMPNEIQWNGNMSDNWKFFVQKFKIYLIASKNSLEQSAFQVALLLNIIGDRALKVFNNFTFDKTEDKENIDIVLKKFEDYFMPEKNVTYERHMFFLREKRNGESIDSYVTELRDLCSTCEFGQISDSLIKDQIILGIKDRVIKDRLLRIKDLDLSKAVEVCRAAEQSKSQLEGICNNQDSTSIDIHKLQLRTGNKYNNQGSIGNTSKWKNKMAATPVKQNHNSLLSSNSSFSNNKCKSFSGVVNNKISCHRCGYNHKKSNCPAYGKKCMKCHKIGHFANMCLNRNRPIHFINEEESIEIVNTIDIVSAANDKDWVVNILINEFLNVKFKVDTGSQVNIINTDVLDLLDIDQHNLVRTNHKLTSYTGQALKILGKCTLQCIYKNNHYDLQFYVVDAKSTCILGLSSSVDLNVVKITDEIRLDKGKRPNINNTCLLDEYSDLFEGIGCLKGESNIYLKNDAVPVVHASRKVPLALLPKLKNKLQELEKMDIIIKVNEPSDWVNSLVIVNKPDGDIRLCLDPKDLNNNIKQQHFQIPTFEEISSKLSGASVFSTLDVKNAFWHIKLNQTSTNLCVFNTPFGRYKFLRLPYGINIASELFQEKMSQLLEKHTGVSVYIDDLIIWGKDKAEHDCRLRKLLDKLRLENVKLNKSKCKIGIDQLKYLGHCISKNGITPDKNKIKAITSMVAPMDKKSLERFLGLVNYVGKFVPNLSEHTASLRSLLKSDVEFKWMPEHDQSFKKLKSMLVSEPILQFFDVQKPIVLTVDSSSHSLGAALLQNELPVAYASKALTTTQQSYSQIEKELLAVLFACDKFHQYVYGRHITIETDHKPLISIVKKNLSQAPPRLQRMLLSLQKYNFTLIYKKGKDLCVADTLSRAQYETDDSNSPMLDDKEVEAQICAIVNEINVSVGPNIMSRISSLTDVDVELKTLKDYLLNTWPNEKKNVPLAIRQYWNIRNELSYFKPSNIILKGDAIVIPRCMRKEMLSRLHLTHCGINKTLLRAKNNIYWPTLYSQVENRLSNCEACLTYTKGNWKEPLKPHSVPNLPWEKVGIDLFQLNDKMYVIIIDYFSKYPEVISLQSTTSMSVINVLKQVFSRHGIPQVVVTGNDVQFTAELFKNFSNSWEFKHITTSPYFSQSNGMVERAIQTVKATLKKAMFDKIDPYLVLLEYRNTPISANIPSPAEILFSRKVRGILPCKYSLLKPKLIKNVKPNLIVRQNTQKRYYDRHTRRLRPLHNNEHVFVKNHNKPEWTKCKIVRRNNTPRSYIVKNEQSGKVFIRNRFHLKPQNVNRPNLTADKFNNQSSLNENMNMYEDLDDYNSTCSMPRLRHLSNRFSPMKSPIAKTPVKGTPCKSPESVTKSPIKYSTRSGRIVNPPSRLDL